MIPHPVPPDDWVAEGHRVASALEEVAAAIVSGSEPEAAALVALAIARAHAGERRVGIADLVGGIGQKGIELGTVLARACHIGWTGPISRRRRSAACRVSATRPRAFSRSITPFTVAASMAIMLPSWFWEVSPTS